MRHSLHWLRSIRIYTQGSIRRQLVWAIGLLSLLTMLAPGYLVYAHQRDFLYRQGVRNADNLAYSLAVSSSSWLVARDLAGLQEITAGFAGTPDLKFAAVVSNRGEVMASTRAEQLGLYFSDPISRRLQQAPPRALVLVSQSDLIDVAAPIMSGNRHVGWARVEMTQTTANEHLRELLWTGLVFVGAAATVAVWLSVALARRLTSRLAQLVSLAEGVGGGLETRRSQVSGDDEIGVLARGFDRMLDALDVQRADLRVAATAFETLEAVVILGADYRFLRVNRSFTRTFGYTPEEVQGQPVDMIRTQRHGRDFYAQAWAIVAGTGTWQGEVWYRRKNGEEFPALVSLTSVRDEQGKISHYVVTMIDIGARKRAEEEIRQLAYYDPLTELPNRRLLLDQLRHALAAARRSGTLGALLFLDLDNFKAINDTLGHDKGDTLLHQVARRLLQTVRESDTVARLGGDEFVVMLTDLDPEPLTAAREAEVVADKLLGALREPYDLEGVSHHNSGSVGVALFGEDESGVEELLKQADLALHQAKEAGRDSYCFFDPTMQASVSERVALERDLRLGLQAGQFLLHFQPQVDGAGRMTGAEVLLRWRHPRRGMVSPAVFIPVAEESGLILPLGHWVLEQACRQLARWAEAAGTAHLSLSVNVSMRQVRQDDFVHEVLAVLARTAANPARLKLELTESVLLNNVAGTIAKMEELKTHGVGFSLDDFGTGYSSLAYLKRLPLDQLKIDQSFVRDARENPTDAAIVQAIVALGRSFGLQVIAEGVETWEQREFLAQHGCHHCQGYLFGKPGPLESLTPFLPPPGLNPASNAADH